MIRVFDIKFLASNGFNKLLVTQLAKILKTQIEILNVDDLLLDHSFFVFKKKQNLINCDFEKY